MLAGVEILLERMKTNPEEFVEGGYSKWSRVMGDGWDIFTEEERTALQNAHKEAKRDHFNGEVMRVLAGDVEETTDTEDERLYKGKRLMQGTSPSILTANTLHKQIKDTLEKQFDKAYAKREGDQVAWWDGRMPRPDPPYNIMREGKK
jgi:hypothetical protein